MMYTATPPAKSPGPSLRDIHLPPEPSWWPPAPGWWVLAVLLLALLLAGIWWWRRQRRAWRRQRLVLRELDALAHRYQVDHDAMMLAAGLHQMLRRMARRHDARATRQRGEPWRRTLARVPVDAPTLEQLLALEQGIYRPAPSFDHVATVAAVRRWLRLALKPTNWKPVDAERADA